LKWKGKPRFIIKGEIWISNCEWDLSGVDDVDFVHFEVSGRFKCNDMVVSSYKKSSLKFLKYAGNNIYVICGRLTLKGIESSLTNHHFTFCSGQSYFTDCVWLCLYDYLLLFSYLRMFQVSFSIKIVETAFGCISFSDVHLKTVIQINQEEFFMEVM
jgi:hypothetical protein